MNVLLSCDMDPMILTEKPNESWGEHIDELHYSDLVGWWKTSFGQVAEVREIVKSRMGHGGRIALNRHSVYKGFFNKSDRGHVLEDRKNCFSMGEYDILKKENYENRMKWYRTRGVDMVVIWERFDPNARKKRHAEVLEEAEPEPSSYDIYGLPRLPPEEEEEYGEDEDEEKPKKNKKPPKGINKQLIEALPVGILEGRWNVWRGEDQLGKVVVKGDKVTMVTGSNMFPPREPIDQLSKPTYALKATCAGFLIKFETGFVRLDPEAEDDERLRGKYEAGGSHVLRLAVLVERGEGGYVLHERGDPEAEADIGFLPHFVQYGFCDIPPYSKGVTLPPNRFVRGVDGYPSWRGRGGTNWRKDVHFQSDSDFNAFFAKMEYYDDGYTDYYSDYSGYGGRGQWGDGNFTSYGNGHYSRRGRGRGAYGGILRDEYGETVHDPEYNRRFRNQKSYYAGWYDGSKASYDPNDGYAPSNLTPWEQYQWFKAKDRPTHVKSWSDEKWKKVKKKVEIEYRGMALPKYVERRQKSKTYLKWKNSLASRRAFKHGREEVSKLAGPEVLAVGAPVGGQVVRDWVYGAFGRKQVKKYYLSMRQKSWSASENGARQYALVTLRSKQQAEIAILKYARNTFGGGEGTKVYAFRDEFRAWFKGQSAALPSVNEASKEEENVEKAAAEELKDKEVNEVEEEKDAPTSDKPSENAEELESVANLAEESAGATVELKRESNPGVGEAESNKGPENEVATAASAEPAENVDKMEGKANTSEARKEESGEIPVKQDSNVEEAKSEKSFGNLEQLWIESETEVSGAAQDPRHSQRGSQPSQRPQRGPSRGASQRRPSGARSPEKSRISGLYVRGAQAKKKRKPEEKGTLVNQEPSEEKVDVQELTKRYHLDPYVVRVKFREEEEGHELIDLKELERLIIERGQIAWTYPGEDVIVWKRVMKECSSCNKPRRRQLYSKNQWQKAGAKPRVCKICTIKDKKQEEVDLKRAMFADLRNTGPGVLFKRADVYRAPEKPNKISQFIQRQMVGSSRIGGCMTLLNFLFSFCMWFVDVITDITAVNEFTRFLLKNDEHVSFRDFWFVFLMILFLLSPMILMWKTTSDLLTRWARDRRVPQSWAYFTLLYPFGFFSVVALKVKIFLDNVRACLYSIYHNVHFTEDQESVAWITLAGIIEVQTESLPQSIIQLLVVLIYYNDTKFETEGTAGMNPIIFSICLSVLNTLFKLYGLRKEAKAECYKFIEYFSIIYNGAFSFIPGLHRVALGKDHCLNLSQVSMTKEKIDVIKETLARIRASHNSLKQIVLSPLNFEHIDLEDAQELWDIIVGYEVYALKFGNPKDMKEKFGKMNPLSKDEFLEMWGDENAWNWRTTKFGDGEVNFDELCHLIFQTPHAFHGASTTLYKALGLPPYERRRKMLERLRASVWDRFDIAPLRFDAKENITKWVAGEGEASPRSCTQWFLRNDIELKYLSSMFHLRRLKTRGIVSPVGAVSVNVPNLVQLDLSASNYREIGLLTQIPSLKKLNLRNCKNMFWDEENPPRLPNLQEIDLSLSNFNQPFLLRFCPLLKNVAMRECAKLRWFESTPPLGLPLLKHIDLSKTNFPHVHLLNQFPQLMSIDVRGCNVKMPRDKEFRFNFPDLKVVKVKARSRDVLRKMGIRGTLLYQNPED